MKIALVIGTLALSVTVARAHNKDVVDTRPMMGGRATAGIGPGASSKSKKWHSPSADDNHLTR
jgi:hypothetical protein